jgi:hypothetical protein
VADVMTDTLVEKSAWDDHVKQALQAVIASMRPTPAEEEVRAHLLDITRQRLDDEQVEMVRADDDSFRVARTVQWFIGQEAPDPDSARRRPLDRQNRPADRPSPAVEEMLQLQAMACRANVYAQLDCAGSGYVATRKGDELAVSFEVGGGIAYHVLNTRTGKGGLVPSCVVTGETSTSRPIDDDPTRMAPATIGRCVCSCCACPPLCHAAAAVPRRCCQAAPPPGHAAAAGRRRRRRRAPPPPGAAAAGPRHRCWAAPLGCAAAAAAHRATPPKLCGFTCCMHAVH